MHRLWNVPLPVPPRQENSLISGPSFAQARLTYNVDIDMQYQLGERRWS